MAKLQQSANDRAIFLNGKREMPFRPLSVTMQIRIRVSGYVNADGFECRRSGKSIGKARGNRRNELSLQMELNVV